MKEINIRDLKPGMLVGKPVYNENGVCLVAENFSLNDKSIERIQKLNQIKIWINDDYVVIRDYLANELKLRVIKCFESTCTSYSSKKVVSDDEKLAKQKSIVEGVVKDVTCDTECIKLLNDLKTSNEKTYLHSVEVARISLITGINLNLKESELIILCKAALLHDIGKVESSKSASHSSRIHFDKTKSHPKLGYEKLKETKKFNSLVYVSVYQHHERYDGNGYPRYIKNKDITLFAKIISVANFFSNLLIGNTSKEPYSISEALECLYTDSSRQFDPKILKIFVSKLPVYEIGQIIKLSSGDKAVVIHNNEACISRPIVRIFNENKTLGSEIDLSEIFNVTIL